jgi:hypothetical protein
MDLALRDVYLTLERPREIRVSPPALEPHDDRPYVMRAPTPGELASAPEQLAAGRSCRFSDYQGVHQALEIALDDPNVQRRLVELGIDPAPKDKRSSDWLKPFIKAEISFWKPLLAGLGL